MATWQPKARGLRSEVDWSDWSVRDCPLDPYLVWADLTAFAGFSSGVDPDEDRAYRDNRWPLLVELSRADLPVQSRTLEVPAVFGVMRIAGIYTVPLPDSGDVIIPWRFLTARVDPRELGHLLASSYIVRFQLGLPRIADTGVQQTSRQDQTSGKRSRIVVGVIDDGCPFAHAMLHDAQGRTRVRYLWDQDDGRRPDPDTELGWRRPQDLGYGVELDEMSLADAAARAAPGRELAPYAATHYGRIRLDETRATTELRGARGALSADMLAAGTHGSGVLAIATGRPSPLAEQLAPDNWRGGELTARAMLDRLGESVTEMDELQRRALLRQADCAAAADTDVVFVQLPTRCVLDTSGGSLGVHVLDGLQYILDRAQRLPDDGTNEMPPRRRFFDNRIVVNISYGALAGGHDGTSLIELAIRELVRKGDYGSGRLWVVLAAGNAHRARTQASLELRPGDIKNFVWNVGPDNPRASFLEVWFPLADVEGTALPARWIDALSLSVQGPGLPPLAQLCVGQIQQYAAGDGAPLAATIFVRRSAQSRRGTMLLIAVAPTRRAKGSQWLGTHGPWVVEVGWMATPNQGPRVRLHAWSERDDLLHGVPRRQQSRVVSDDPVPEPTEFFTDSLKVLRRGATLRRDEPPPHPLEPDLALGSLASVTAARPDFASVGSVPIGGQAPEDADLDLPTADRGEVVTVGARRLLDDEMSVDSSGGPARDLSDAGRRAAAFGSRGDNDALRGPLLRRVGPDVDAPGDLSPAVRGLRVPGVRPGASVRLSATSAAAASITRAIATVQWMARDARPLSETDAQAEDRLASLLFEEFHAAPDRQPVDGSPRPTPTPRMDDAFRRGRRRLR